MEALLTFQKYMGTGMVLVGYMAAVLYLFLTEKRRPFRILFVYVPACILLLFFQPIFYKLFSRFLGMEIYFRMIWLLPVSVTLAFTMVKILGEFQGRKKIVLGLVFCMFLVLGGKLVYTNPLFSRAENLHHVPQEVVEICDAISLPGREVRAAFPSEFLLYVRQYSSSVCMPYGRSVLQGYCDEFELLMKREEIDVEKMAEYSKARSCHYVIFSEKKVLCGEPEDYDFEWFGKVGEYLIYKDTTMNFATTMD